MRTKLLLFALYFIYSIAELKAQVPQGMNYQAIARNSSGTILQSKLISIRFTITNGNVGQTLYREHDTITTNQFGLFTLNVGNGIVDTGAFSSISWGTVTPWMEVEMDANGGSNYMMMGSSQLLSVPYALYAKTTSSSGFSNMQVFSTSGTFIFTIPAGVAKIMVEVWGGGGGGGISFAGSGGGYGKQIFTVAPNSIDTVIVAGGGTGTLTAGARTGETSSFGSLISATGGNGGTMQGGGYSSADFSITGQSSDGNVPCFGANGGAGGESGDSPTIGTAPGGGGGGGNGTNTAGASGAVGRVVVCW